MKDAGARPAFKGYYVPAAGDTFRFVLCTSINDEVIHGMPSAKRVLKKGDIVSIDTGVQLDGYYGDSATTVAIGEISEQARKLMRVTHAGTWKMHAEDLAHGESVSLDDTDWQPVALMAKAPNDAVWFRQTIQIPDTLNGYDLTGARAWFQFHAEANGPMPQIIYFNGRRAAMGEDLEPIVLVDDARPGDKIVIAVKLLHTVDVKTFNATMNIDFASGRPNPEDLAQEFLSASVLLPSLAPGDY